MYIYIPAYIYIRMYVHTHTHTHTSTHYVLHCTNVTSQYARVPSCLEKMTGNGLQYHLTPRKSLHILDGLQTEPRKQH
jgi:hypothetical protein